MPEPFKNHFHPGFTRALANAIRAVYPAFDTEAFFASVHDEQWEARELKARMRHMTVCLRAFLPDDYRSALAILRALEPPPDRYRLALLVLPDFVEVYGLADWDASIAALEQFTQQSTAEFAVRPFIIADQPRMMEQMLRWAGHENEHVRRLASEGCRPRLPWGVALPALKRDPTPILPVLERLKNDESEYVRRSVANNLNDIAKDNPDIALATLRRWNREHGEGVRWVVAHGLRTLVKEGNRDALALLGYEADGGFALNDLTVTPDTVRVGENITLRFAVENRAGAPLNLMIDYIIHHARANGKRSPKVFKLTKRTLAPGERVEIRRQHSFRPVTTRRYYAGEHVAEIQINGVVCGSAPFMLVDAPDGERA
ncbi:MAG: DNA alkylation repair protein [Chloroflexota bacterium]|nr:MAG: hypothetical protein DIU68_17415 [Chloroflexota bacterium]